MEHVRISTSTAAAALPPSIVGEYARWLRRAQPGAIAPPPVYLGAGTSLDGETALGIALLMREAEAAGFVTIGAIVAAEGLAADIWNFRAVRTDVPLPPRWQPEIEAAAVFAGVHALRAAALPDLRRAA